MVRANIMIPRDLAVKLGEEAVRIIEARGYQAPSGQLVNIASLLEYAVRETRSYPPDVVLPETRTGPHQTEIEVKNETTLAAARRLVGERHNPVALNFAAATHPGGGFLSGARAQEEYLARSSGLYACIRDNPMYEFHRSNYNPLYTNYAIYSPKVPVFRTDDGVELLEEPYPLSIITSPAVNAAQLGPARHGEIAPAMWLRIIKVLAIGILHGHDSIVLGTWGCGAFGNDANEIAEVFGRALQNNFKSAYHSVTFAIGKALSDWNEAQRWNPSVELRAGVWNDWNLWNCPACLLPHASRLLPVFVACCLVPAAYSVERLERLEQLELLERPVSRAQRLNENIRSW